MAELEHVLRTQRPEHSNQSVVERLFLEKFLVKCLLDRGSGLARNSPRGRRRVLSNLHQLVNGVQDIKPRIFQIFQVNISNWVDRPLGMPVAGVKTRDLLQEPLRMELLLHNALELAQTVLAPPLEADDERLKQSETDRPVVTAPIPEGFAIATETVRN